MASEQTRVEWQQLLDEALTAPGNLGNVYSRFHDYSITNMMLFMMQGIHDHDPTALCAGIARQARQRFGIVARQVHVDTTACAVSGEYEAELDAHTVAVTYGYSRDHRADLKQWMLALATTRQGDVPLFCQALDGNASDKLSLVAVVEALAEQLRAEDAEAPIFVADSGLYSGTLRQPTIWEY